MTKLYHVLPECEIESFSKNNESEKKEQVKAKPVPKKSSRFLFLPIQRTKCLAKLPKVYRIYRQYITKMYIISVIIIQ